MRTSGYGMAHGVSSVAWAVDDVVRALPQLSRRTGRMPGLGSWCLWRASAGRKRVRTRVRGEQRLRYAG